MKAACKAQRDAFAQAGNAPKAARATMLQALDQGCVMSLEAYGKMPNAPAACSAD